jgi:hypothetical protein
MLTIQTISYLASFDRMYCLCVCVCVYIYIYTHTHTHGKRLTEISYNQKVFPIITTLYDITIIVLHIKICHIILLTIFLHNKALISVHVPIHSENKTRGA